MVATQPEGNFFFSLPKSPVSDGNERETKENQRTKQTQENRAVSQSHKEREEREIRQRKVSED